MNVKAIIFDMDGVLFDSTAAHARAYNLALEEVGLSPVDYAGLAGKRTDLALSEIFSGIPQLVYSEEMVQDVTARKRELANQLLAQDPPVVAGCADMLHELSRSYTLALASSASRKNIELFLKASGAAACFGAVLSGEDVALGKPAPDIYLKAMQEINCESSATFVVEDSLSGVEAGLKAGARVLGIVGTCSAAALREAGTTDNLDDIKTIPAWFAKQN